jgi:hypothetical protein
MENPRLPEMATHFGSVLKYARARVNRPSIYLLAEKTRQ